MKPGSGLDGSGVWYEEVALGDSFARTVTITDAHLVLGAGLIGDFNPHHVDDAFAGRSRFGTRILHGVITSALMGAPVGMYFHGTAIAYLEHNARFKAPVRPGDTLTTTWTVTALAAKPKHGGGVVTLAGVARNQDGVVVAEAEGRMLVATRASEPGPSRRRDRQLDVADGDDRAEVARRSAATPAPPRTPRRARARGR